MNEPAEVPALHTVLAGFRRRAIADEALRWSLRAAIAVCGWGLVMLIVSRIWPIAGAVGIWTAGRRRPGGRSGDLLGTEPARP